MEEENKVVSETTEPAETREADVVKTGPTTETNSVQNDSTTEQSGATSTPVYTNPEPPVTEPTKKKSKKVPIIIGIVALLAIIGGVVAFLFLKPGSSGISIGAKAETNRYIAAKYDADKVAYVPLMDGNIAKVDDNVFKTAISPDRKHIVVLTMDKELYFTNADQSEKTKVTDNGNSLVEIGDKGFVYSDYDGDYHRYMYADGSDVNLGAATDIQVSEENFNIAFVVEDSIYMLLESSQDKEKMGNITNECEILHVSNDGKTVYWDDNKDYEEVIYVYTNGEKSKVGTFETDSKYTSTYVIHNEGKNYAAIVNYNAQDLFVVTGNGDPIKVKLGNKLYSSTVYTKNGLLSKDSASAYSGIYVSVTGSDGNNLYFIDAKGEREKVMSNIGQYSIYEGNLYYVDDDSNLKVAKLTDATLSDEEKITGDVEIVYSSCINGYLYFMKDVSSSAGTGILYVYKKGSDPVKISSDASCYASSYGWSYIYGNLSSDGKTFYYYKDTEEIPDTYSDSGVLYRFTYGSSESEKISSDVIVGTLDSGYTSGLLNNNSFIYMKYMSVNKDEDIVGDWCYFNGTEGKTMASDILK